MVPWCADGLLLEGKLLPSKLLACHTGSLYSQDASSMLPVECLDVLPGQTVVDLCAAPGSKTTQIGLKLGDRGLLIAADASSQRRRALRENLARQGVACALITPLAPRVLADQMAGQADRVLVDAPCSGATPASAGTLRRLAQRQTKLLKAGARLCRPGGRMVYSTCTASVEENEQVIETFLRKHPEWSVIPTVVPGAQADLHGLGCLRIHPDTCGSEAFFTAVLQVQASGDTGPVSAEADAEDPDQDDVLRRWLPQHALKVWSVQGNTFAASRQVAACDLQSEARGLYLGRLDEGLLPLWAAQAVIERGALTLKLSRDQARRAFAGDSLPAECHAGDLLCTESGMPLGMARCDEGRPSLNIPDSLLRDDLI